MSNLTSVGISSGVPNSGTGTVSTLDNLPNLVLQNKITDGTNTAAVKAASTAPVATDPAVVVAISPNSVNANGQAAMAASAPIVLASDQTTVAVGQDVSQLCNGASGTYLTPKRATISCSSSGANTIITPTVGKKILVLQWIVKVNAAVNFKWQTQTGSTDLTGLFYNSAQGDGAGGSYAPIGHFQTSTNSDALILNLSGAVAVGGYLVYVEI